MNNAVCVSQGQPSGAQSDTIAAVVVVGAARWLWRRRRCRVKNNVFARLPRGSDDDAVPVARVLALPFVGPRASAHARADVVAAFRFRSRVENSLARTCRPTSSAVVASRDCENSTAGWAHSLVFSSYPPLRRPGNSGKTNDCFGAPERIRAAPVRLSAAAVPSA